jgi:hypothetical protein
MPTGRDTKLTGAVGEFLVAAELCRRGLLATPFAGNVPYYDIIASGKVSGHVAIQVKAINRSAWQFDIRKYVNVQMDADGKHQNIGNPQPEPYPGLLCVLVVLRGTGQDRFFVLEWKELRDVLADGYHAYLSKHEFVRPRQPESFHVALGISDVAPFENAWDKVLHRVS